MRAFLLAVALTAAVLAAAAAAGPSQPRVTPSGLVYVGSFRLPAPVSDTKTFAYGGTALAYDPVRDGLFVVGHDWYQLDAEVSIPAPERRSSVDRLPRARFLQPFVDPTNGRIDDTGGTDNKLGGQLVYGGRLVGSVYVYYDAAGRQVRSHWARPTTQLAGPGAAGLFAVGDQGAGFVSGFMAAVPAAWQAALGGPALTGNCCIPIISRTSFGPDAFAFDPARLRGAGPVPASPLVYYPQAHPSLGAWGQSWNPRRGILWDGATAVRGVVFPEGTRSVLFFGTQGIGAFCYGEGTDQPSLAGKPTPDGTTWCYDPDQSSKGTHGYPYVPEVWAYDARDLAAAHAGRVRPWRVRPYATWRLRLPFGSPQIGGAAYDPAHNLVFVSQQFADGDQPLIDVFRVG